MKEKYIIEDFKHKVGVHCESSSLRDMFEFYGFPMTEAMVFALDGTLGFGFFDGMSNFRGDNTTDLPLFVGGKQDTINPNSLACRLLGITLRKQSFTSSQKAWEEVKKLIAQNIPVMLQVDLAYLDYMELKENIHFGGHFITLGGYDETKGIAYVGDTDFGGFQAVPLEKLNQARSSEYGPTFLQPKNAQYSMLPRPDGKHPPLTAGVKLAIQKAVNHMLRPSMSNNGLQGLKNFAGNILTWNESLNKNIKNPYNQKDYSLARLNFELIYGYIEKWGTGGALFRNLYRSFLEEIIENSSFMQGPNAWTKEEMQIIENCIPMINDSAQKWTEFAFTLKKAAENFKKDCLKMVDLSELSKKIDIIRIVEEKLFHSLLAIKI
jgi:hypothetical protein